MSGFFPWLNQDKVSCLRTHAIPPVRLKQGTSKFKVAHSTTQPLCYYTTGLIAIGDKKLTMSKQPVLFVLFEVLRPSQQLWSC